jgi:hypothetical protein
MSARLGALRADLVQVISLEWLKWLRRPLVSQEKRGIEPIKRAAIQRELIGVHLRSPTDKNLEDDSVDGRNLPVMPEPEHDRKVGNSPKRRPSLRPI